MDEITFYLDENIADGLRRRGIDVLTTAEAGYMGWTDDEQLNFALAQKRVTVTQDDDFLRLANSGVEHAGTAYYKSQTRSIKQVLNSLIFEVLTSEEMMNSVEYV